MRRCIQIVLGWMVAATAASAVTVTGLQHELEGREHVFVIDVRMPEAFAAGHIPGAINVPASVCAAKRFPALGKVVVYGSGIGADGAAAAASVLSREKGLSVGVLEGGFAAWQSAHGLTTAARGVRPESLNYISYADLKRAAPEGVLLVDLRRSRTAGRTDLAAEFSGLPVVAAAPASGGALAILIDDGDGTAQAAARRLKASGNKQYAILVGGELTLARHGQRGSQRTGGLGRLPAAGLAKP